MSIQRLSNSGQSGFRYKSLIAGITPVASVPVIGEATALTFSTASVTFTAPGAYAGVTFTATSSPGGITGTSATSPITVSGLSEQTAYTFTVTATNASGTSSPSAASNSVTTPVAFTPDSGYDSLATVNVSTNTTTITFSGIPADYKHLQLRILARSNKAGQAYDYLRLRINGATGSSYSRHALLGNGSAASANASANDTLIGMGEIPAATATASIFGGSIIDLLDYKDTNKNRTVRGLIGEDKNGSGSIYLASGAYYSTTAVTSLSLFCGDGGDFIQYSSFALYGIK
jgi:hypothetical protein